ncbi:hypothetical protein GCM10010909_16180 [Acidocella aquatica]|uniref:Type I restriction modification DNA specificity domain-containing protein n=1 Tax=Acidocella aquatica TaxID=1922313 RepID=A0ABQ6A5K4_9PROT|nr:restriction endonuclease subunit S [Acidocella aquatica]GLR66938.1 hypothetical protein GCM10010909_16180 [Acidocella aquatica]
MAGWTVQDFERCIEPVKYGTKIKRADFLESGEYPIISQEAEFINGYWHDEADLYAPDRPVIIFGDHTKALKYVDFPFVLGADGVKILKPKAFLNPKFFYYWLQSIRFESLGYARHYRLLLEQIVAYPPLPEQKRIVAILDEAFAGIAAATANAEKNLGNARELFENYVESVFLQQSENWIEKSLGSIGGDVFTGPFGSLLHKADYVTGGTPLVNPAHIIDGKIIPDTEKTIDPAALERLQNYCLKAGDVVIGRRGEIGRCAVVTAREDGWLCGTGCFYIRVFEKTNPHFLAALLRSKHYRQKLEALSTGATMLNLSNTTLSEFKIRVPHLVEQNNLMKAMEGLSKQIELLEIAYQKKLAALADLKQAILQKGFSGDLTALPAAALHEEAA